MASENGDLTKIKNLIVGENNGEFKAQINFKGLDNWTALHYACSENHCDIVQYLIDNKANIEAKSQIDRTPLHIACLRGHEEVVNVLITHNSDIESKDMDNYTGLHFASEFGHHTIVAMLLLAGSDARAKTNLGYTPFDIAMNIEVRDVFANFEQENDQDISSSYSRTQFAKVILHNDRINSVQKLMGKYEKVNKYLHKQNGSEQALIENISEE